MTVIRESSDYLEGVTDLTRKVLCLDGFSEVTKFSGNDCSVSEVGNYRLSFYNCLTGDG